jgi:hypothetical protein
MVIVFESKTGFTKKYAEMLAAKTGFKVFHVKALPKAEQDEEIIFLGWMKAGKIQGLNKARKYKVMAVCGSGSSEAADPDTETVITRNKIKDVPFFYMRGGCLPIDDLKGPDKFLMSIFVKMLKSRKERNNEETINNIIKGFNGVKEDNLQPLLKWINAR